MRKRGAKIKNTLALKPLGVKASKYELHARFALVALEHDSAMQQHCVDLYVLADLCERMKAPTHVLTHCHALKRVIEEVHQADYHCTNLHHIAAAASTDILIEWFHAQPNAMVARTALKAMEEMR